MRRALVLVVALFLGACSNNKTYPTSGSLIPATKIGVSPGYTIPLEKIVYWAGTAAVAYYIIDPLAPNWEIEEAAFPEDHYRLSLRMKRFYNGGAGESRVVFNHRADELMRKGGFDGYRILDYTEGVESSVLGSQRVSAGTIVLTRSNPVDQGVAAPARITSPSAENPRS
jgi:hypothetical protein